MDKKETKKFEQDKLKYEKKLRKLFDDMHIDGVGMVPTVTMTITPFGQQLIWKPMGTNYTLIETPKKGASKKEQKEKKAKRKNK